MKRKHLGLIVTGAIITGVSSLILGMVAYKETERALEKIGEQIKSDKEQLEKFSVEFE